ncbi:hypothetical protein DERP_012552 [Dermatophagoides pteronyssinus]|uniref:Uncharacterized protein n=1 Tax=Dermatophagoides pteronyssinus TaxID=6956 RepID=A0ABQ8IUT8_DERPT|nr:hypothetical protein DERP_012552 [Dermatophagoides pteronyssinus]
MDVMNNVCKYHKVRHESVDNCNFLAHYIFHSVHTEGILKLKLMQSFTFLSLLIICVNYKFYFKLSVNVVFMNSEGTRQIGQSYELLFVRQVCIQVQQKI